MTGELNAHPRVRRAARRGRCRGVEPMTSVTPMEMKKRADVVTDGSKAADDRRQRPGHRQRFLPGAQGGGIRLCRCSVAVRTDPEANHDDRPDQTDDCRGPRQAAGQGHHRRRADRGLSRGDRSGQSDAQCLCRGHPRQARARWPKRSDERLANGEAGALEGIPLGIKDLFATEGVHTQACSHILDGFKPRYEFDRHRQSVGRRRGDARQAQHGRVRHGLVQRDLLLRPGRSIPWRLARQVLATCRRASACAGRLAAGWCSAARRRFAARICCAGATATDTGGSIRQPAAFTGTVGIKPTYGRCSRWGIVAFASSLDQAGPIARDVRDAAILLKSMASVDPKDTTSRRSAGAGLRGGDRPVDQGHEGRHSEGIPRRRHARGDRGAVAEGHRLAEGRRRRDRRHLAAAHQIRAAGLLHRRAGRSLVQPRPL